MKLVITGYIGCITLILFCSCSSFQKHDLYSMKSYFIKGDFTPDGNKDKKIWASAKTSQSIIMDWRGQKSYPQAETTVKSLWSKNHLYFLFTSKFETLAVDGNLPTDEGGNTIGIADGDVIELFITDKPDIYQYYEFQVSPLGQKSDIYQNRCEPRVLDRSWNSKWQVAVEVDYTFKIWTSEFRIPWNTLSSDNIMEGKSLRFNAFRCSGSYTNGNQIYMAVSPTRTEVPDFHRPEVFGTLALVSSKK